METVKGKKTSREGLVVVNPLADDPQSKEVAFERIVSPGKTARLYGSNLQNVTAILLGGNTITDPTYVESADENYLEYIVPTGVSEGDYRIVLQDADGNQYGADMVKVTNASLVISGANRATANVDWTISGINLENIASLTIGGQTVSQFSNQSSTEVTLTCPDLSDGSYTLTGKTRSGDWETKQSRLPKNNLTSIDTFSPHINKIYHKANNHSYLYTIFHFYSATSKLSPSNSFNKILKDQ